MCACARADRVPGAEHGAAGGARERPHGRAAGARGAPEARPADCAPRALLPLHQPLRAQEEPAARARRARYACAPLSLLASLGVGVCCASAARSAISAYALVRCTAGASMHA